MYKNRNTAKYGSTSCKNCKLSTGKTYFMVCLKRLSAIILVFMCTAHAVLEPSKKNSGEERKILNGWKWECNIWHNNDRVDQETNSPSSSTTIRPAWSRSSDFSHPETLLSTDAMTSLWKINVFLGQGGSWSPILNSSLFCPLHSVPEKSRRSGQVRIYSFWKLSSNQLFPVLPSDSVGNHSWRTTNWRMQQLGRWTLSSLSSLSPLPSCLLF